jgi:phosphoesterase RecJ-like protein
MHEQIAAIIKEYDRFAITAHLGPEADAIGAQLGVMHILQSFGKEAIPVLRDVVPHNLAFLPGANSIVSPIELDKDAVEVWFVVDCGQLNRVGEGLAKWIEKHPVVVNIDHHKGNPEFGHVNWVQITASTTMIIYELAKLLAVDITPELATCLYSGIIADTDSFRNSNTTVEVLETAAELLHCGADAREITVNIYESRTEGETKLLGYTLLNSQLSDGIIWISIPQSIFNETGATVNETERLAEELRATDGVKVAILLKELPTGRIKVSLRSKDGVDVSDVARVFGGGGHAQAAGCLIEGDLYEVENELISEVKKSLLQYESAL